MKTTEFQVKNTVERIEEILRDYATRDILNAWVEIEIIPQQWTTLVRLVADEVVKLEIDSDLEGGLKQIEDYLKDYEGA
jgi:hypothetical protein